ncbi:MAG: transketolase [Candidatus Brocadia sp.]|nr:Transketolase [Candidatus Brocadia fulgida]MCC6326161.1 transketolase [Candidatus Brocadia sp.]MCE7912602.1 transketolase [Candidatus Brocadia sp. AMX3]MDG5998017.1 transketolase [Candidatus Brocadia sp.]RIJ94982.1 MAG: transketolase [Candidatus Brocadia sp.]
MLIQKIDKEKVDLAVNTLRMLSADAVEKAQSGHPGLPMGFADIAFVLWMQFLRFHPEDPQWPNRDRFILSAGHGSALLYSLLHLFGYDVSLEDLKQFRQFGSKTPGHPEYRHTPGVEVTTGPLGQGFANGVGMALAQRMLAERFNKDGSKIIHHHIYGVVSDGDLMEGITSEAASLAGHLGLSNIIYVYDSNQISIEGTTSLTFTEDVGKRFEAYNWRVMKIDGHNHQEIAEAIEAARNEQARPSLIIARTHIGRGSPNKQDMASAHGEPLGAKELELTKDNIGWPQSPTFLIPDEVLRLCRSRVDELREEYNQWQDMCKRHFKSDPHLSKAWNTFLQKEIPADLELELLKTIKKDAIATRSASGDMIQVIAQRIPSLMGGSADLSPSTKTSIKSSPSLEKTMFSGRNIHFGVREHAMGGILNGLALYGGIIPFGSTFLMFSDYMRPPIRLAAMMKIQVIYVFTHDSIFVGEDGPTHQPIEQLPSLRAIPNLLVIRPSDATETAAAWITALKHKNGPTALILTRQDVPVIIRSIYPSQSQLQQGAYILKDSVKPPEIVLMATGSEVAIALDATLQLQGKGIQARLLSVPCFELFRSHSAEYRNSVLPPDCRKRVAIEAAGKSSWYELVGLDGLIIGLDGYGASAPAKILAEHYGFTVKNILSEIARKWGV